MKIKNIGGKIIRLGTLTLLPGETELLPKDFEDNPVVEHFVDMGLVVLEESAKANKPDKANGQQASGGQKSDDEKPDDDKDNGGEQEPGIDNNEEEQSVSDPDKAKSARNQRNK